MNDTLQTSDGLALHVRRWPVPESAGPARGTMMIVHGLGEHIGRYEHLAAQLSRWGWHVVGYDQRGHGRSGGGKSQLAAPESLLHLISHKVQPAP